MAITTLADLTPAECLVLLDPNAADAKTAIKMTLLDLWARQTIRFTMRQERTRFRGMSKNKIFLMRGFSEHVFPTKHHEQVLQDGLPMPGDIELKKFARQAATRIRSVRNYKEEFLLQPMCRAGLLEKQRSAFLFTRYELTELGRDLNGQLVRNLGEAEAHMPAWLATDLIKAKRLLAQLGTKILLLPNLVDLMRDAKDRLVLSPLPEIIAGADLASWHQNSTLLGRTLIELEVVFDLLNRSEAIFSETLAAIDTVSFDRGSDG
ncbi:MAG: hypothetical protein AAFY56_22090 [Pseudomonadota bacterium]